MAVQEFALPPMDSQHKITELLAAAELHLSMLTEAQEASRVLFRAMHADLYASMLDSKAGTELSEVFESVSEKGFTELPILSVTIDGTVVRRESLDRHVSDETGEEKYIRVLPDDLVYNTMRLWQGAIGIVGEEGLVSPAYTVLRLKDSSDGPLFWWQLFRSPHIISEYRRLVKGVAKDRWRIYFADLRRLRIDIPLPGQRKQVAEYLEAIRLVGEEIQKRRNAIGALRGQITEKCLGVDDV